MESNSRRSTQLVTTCEDRRSVQTGGKHGRSNKSDGNVKTETQQLWNPSCCRYLFFTTGGSGRSWGGCIPVYCDVQQCNRQFGRSEKCSASIDGGACITGGGGVWSEGGSICHQEQRQQLKTDLCAWLYLKFFFVISQWQQHHFERFYSECFY